MHDPNGIYDPQVQLSAIRLRLQWFRELDHYKVTDEEVRLMLRERQLLNKLKRPDSQQPAVTRPD